MALETEIATYDARLDEIRQHPGEYVLIAGTEIVAYFPTWEEALDVGYANYEPGHFMIRQESGPDAVRYLMSSWILEPLPPSQNG